MLLSLKDIVIRGQVGNIFAISSRLPFGGLLEPSPKLSETQSKSLSISVPTIP